MTEETSKKIRNDFDTALKYITSLLITIIAYFLLSLHNDFKELQKKQIELSTDIKIMIETKIQNQNSINLDFKRVEENLQKIEKRIEKIEDKIK